MPYGGSLLLPLQPFVEDAFPSTLPQEVDNRFSTLLSQVLPDYVVSDHPVFVEFLRAYLEYTEQFGNTRGEAVRLETYTDVDQTLDSFVKHFRKSYLDNFPEELYVGLDVNTVIKNIKSYYGEKGTPRSLDLLFRILYNKSADVENVSNQIIRLSDSDYSPSTTIRTTRFNVSNILDFIGGSIKQTTSLDDVRARVLATGFVESIVPRQQDGLDYAEIFLTNVNGEFNSSFEIQLDHPDVGRSVQKTYSIIKSVKAVEVNGIAQNGINYRVGDKILIKNGNEVITTLRVTSTATDGGIVTVSNSDDSKIFRKSVSYDIEVITANGSGADLEILQAAQINLDNTFKTTRSRISTDAKIQDNFSVQDYAYRIKSEVDLVSYARTVKLLFHPAGRLMFGQYIFNRDFQFQGLTFDVALLDNRPRINALIGNYLPYTFGTTADLRGDTFGSTYGDYYPTGFDGLTAATFGNFDADGNAITHDPFDFFEIPDLPTPVGKDEDYAYADVQGDLANGRKTPEYIYNYTGSDPDSPLLGVGYRVAPFPQPRMIETDSITNDYYTVYRHPRVLLGLKESSETMRRIAPMYIKNDTTGIVSGRFNQVKFVIQNAVGSVSVGETLTQKIPRLPVGIAEVTAVEERLPSQFVGGKDWNAKIITQEDIDNDISLKIKEIQSNYQLLRSMTYQISGGSSLKGGVSSSASRSAKSVSKSETVNLYTELRAVDVLLQAYQTGFAVLAGNVALGVPVVTITPSFSAQSITQTGLGRAVGYDPVSALSDVNTKLLRSQIESDIYPNGPTRDDGSLVTVVTATLKNGAFSNQTDSKGNKYSVNTNTGSSFNLSGTGIQGTVLQVQESFVEKDLPFEDIVIETFLENMKAPTF